ncbi:BrnT family toxin [Actimicrobium sp. CCI2.3]|uniref:BrnT family toxin n=1 Tax=Actimicrobium sp. CCI2.3 TaxID=3048616 RepID=UPI003A102E9A
MGRDQECSNQQKHGVSFETARHVFDDPLHLTRQDRVEQGEERWQTIGLVGGVILLLVAHTWHDTDDGTEHIRLISARRATKLERKIDEQGF